MDWRNIPSLSALRAFEAAARTASLSSAARELNVTHAAIAQHVRTLETRFDGKLLVRDGQRMQTTPQYERIHDGFTLRRRRRSNMASKPFCTADFLASMRPPISSTSPPAMAGASM